MLNDDIEHGPGIKMAYSKKMMWEFNELTPYKVWKINKGWRNTPKLAKRGMPSSHLDHSPRDKWKKQLASLVRAVAV